MANDRNDWSGTGRVVRDASPKPAGASTVLDFTLAVNASWRDRQTDEWKNKATFVHCIAWGKVAESYDGFAKGQELVVFGRLGTKDPWTSKDGVEHPATMIVNVSHIAPTGDVVKHAEETPDQESYPDDMPF